jgi:hypothetical protein
MLRLTSDSAYAYYTPSTEKVHATSGSLLTTTGVKDFTRSVFAAESKEIEYLLRSIIHKQLIDPTTDTITQIVGVYSQMANMVDLGTLEKLFAIYLHEVMDWADRKKLRKELGVRDDVALMNKLLLEYADLPVTLNILSSAELLTSNLDQIKFLIVDNIDKNIDRYIAAKQFILDELFNNRYNSQGVTRTKVEMIGEVLAKVKPEKVNQPTRYIDELETELEVLKQKALQLTSKLNTKTGRDAYSSLISQRIPELENKIFALRSLSKKNLRTGKMLFFDILSDIYPKSSVTNEKSLELITEDLEYAINDRGERELVSAAGINEYMKDYSKSYELTLSESMKDFLSYIPVENKPGTYLNSGLAYIKMMQLVTSLVWSKDLNFVLVQLSDMLRNKPMSNIDRVIANSLLKLISDALTTQDLSGHIALANNISITTTVSKNTGVVSYAAIYSATRDVSNLTYQEAIASNDVEVGPLTQSSSELFSWLSKKGELPTSVYNTLFRRAEAVNALREIHNVMTSMKETELYLTTRSNTSGTKFANIRSKASGVSFGIKNDIITRLRELHLDDKLVSFKQVFKDSEKEA